MGDMISMSKKELDRTLMCEMMNKGLIKQEKAAEFLEISLRQTKRLLKKYRTDGEKGLISKKRGKSSNRGHDAELKNRIKTLLENDYIGFGPTFAAEKLKEIAKISINKETLRRYMIHWGMWKPKRGKYCSIHQQRPRREHFGELIQIDGSPHDWFEGRGPKCCLIVFVDDATSKAVGMHFVPTENTQAYFECIKKYIKKYGLPWAFYSDRHGIFRVNKPGCEDKETQFKRAMNELGIETICAHSPQAKGRVERANRTLQDRLIKEMRLRNISSIEKANKYLEEFIEDYNKKFGKKPQKEADVHRKELPMSFVLDAILCERYFSKLSQNLEFKFEGNTYQVITKDPRGLRDMPTEICRFADGEIKVWHKNAFVECKKFGSSKKTIAVVSGKEINKVVDCICDKTDEKQLQPWKKVRFLNFIDKKQREQTVLP